MTPRQTEVLGALMAFTNSADRYEWHPKWARPLDIGGFNGSNHGPTLAILYRMGLVDRVFSGGSQRRNYKYRINDDGRRALAQEARP
jgi:hypothetical protein